MESDPNGMSLEDFRKQREEFLNAWNPRPETVLDVIKMIAAQNEETVEGISRALKQDWVPTEDDYIDALTEEDWNEMNDPDGVSKDWPRGMPKPPPHYADDEDKDKTWLEVLAEQRESDDVS